MKNRSELDEIHHVAINVAELDKSIKWYTTSFQCDLVYEDARLAILEFSNLTLHLVLPSEQPAHVAYIRDDAHTLGELREQKDGTKTTYLSDPSGKPVEIVAKDSVRSQFQNKQ